jgi:carboxypeptidase Taq
MSSAWFLCWFLSAYSTLEQQIATIKSRPTLNPDQAYAELVQRSREDTLLSSCLALLEWDEEIYMPRGGVEHRAEQMALMAGLVHDRETDPRYDELLSTVEASSLVSDPDSAQAVNAREIRRTFDRQRRMPRRLVEEWARATAHGSQTWAEARKQDDFKMFAPWLEKIFGLAREKADAMGYEGEPYDALVEDYEPGMTTDLLSTLFTQLQPQLVPLLDSLRDKTASTPADLLEREYPLDRQHVFAEGAAAAIGFDLECGRFDEAQHPFCTAIGPGDVRIGMRYDPRNFTRGFFAGLHETGHALYDQGLDRAHYGTPMGRAVSLGIHESQSRLWENLVGRSEGFWRHFYPQLQRTFNEALHDVSLETFRKQITRVGPGLIRIYADEVTYNLHVIVRFELERALLAGELRAADVPGAWSELYQRHLGIKPEDDRSGCLQDGHWGMGLVGYFPTYTLGNIFAAQLFAAAERALGPLEEAFARGEFRELREWLGVEIHQHGMRYRSAKLIEKATGSAPDPSALIESLARRYGA